MPASLLKTYAALVVIAVSAFGASACGKTGGSSTPASPSPAAPTTTENFNGTLPVGGTSFFSFTSTQYGTVNVTLVSVGGAGVDPAVMLGLAVGSPHATGCVTPTATTVSAGDTPQVTGTYNAGVLCAQITDPGNLTAPATFAITIAHP